MTNVSYANIQHHVLRLTRIQTPMKRYLVYETGAEHKGLMNERHRPTLAACALREKMTPRRRCNSMVQIHRLSHHEPKTNRGSRRHNGPVLTG